jgi:hypothetical protein
MRHEIDDSSFRTLRRPISWWILRVQQVLEAEPGVGSSPDTGPTTNEQRRKWEFWAETQIQRGA